MFRNRDVLIRIPIRRSLPVDYVTDPTLHLLSRCQHDQKVLALSCFLLITYRKCTYSILQKQEVSKNYQKYRNHGDADPQKFFFNCELFRLFS